VSLTEGDLSISSEDLGDVGFSQYHAPIDSYAINREKHTWPQSEYLNGRTVTESNRRLLFNWMLEALVHFGCHAETHMLAFSVMHRFLEATPDLVLGKLQLAGLSVLFTVLKYTERYPPQLQEFGKALLPGFSAADVVEMEKEVLNTIDWHLALPLPLHFLIGYWHSVAPPLGFTKRQSWCLCLYVVELMMVEPSLLRFTPSTVAAAAICVVRILAASFQSQDVVPPWVILLFCFALFCFALLCFVLFYYVYLHSVRPHNYKASQGKPPCRWRNVFKK